MATMCKGLPWHVLSTIAFRIALYTAIKLVLIAYNFRLHHVSVVDGFRLGQERQDLGQTYG